MINKAADSDVQDMAQAVTKNPQWISKMQVSLYACMFAHIGFVTTDGKHIFSDRLRGPKALQDSGGTERELFPKYH